MKTVSDFQQFYQSGLRPKLERFEAQRKRICWQFGGTVLALVLIGVCVYVTFPGWFQSGEAFVVMLVLWGVILAGVWWFLTKGFVRNFKRTIISEVVRYCDPSLRYSPGSFIPRHKFQGSGIFQYRIDRYRGEDQVAGKIGATAFEFSELHAEYKTTTCDNRGRRRTHWHTLFKGLYFIADFNKHFRTKTVVLPDVAEKLFGFLGKKLQEMNLFRSGELIKLEDPEFEKHFAVYGEDQIEARYILSTSLMHRITEFKKKTGEEVYMSFVNSNVHIAIKTRKDIFDNRLN